MAQDIRGMGTRGLFALDEYNEDGSFSGPQATEVPYAPKRRCFRDPDVLGRGNEGNSELLKGFKKSTGR